MFREERMMRIRKYEDRKWTLIFSAVWIGLLVIAVLLFIRTTPEGLGLVSDSVNYLNGASMLATGRGYSRLSGAQTIKPITNFPPLYSIVLAPLIAAGVSSTSAAWWVALVFYGLNLMAVGAIVTRATGNRWFGCLAGALFLTSKPFLEYQVYAMSESVFFFTTLVCFWMLFDAMERDCILSWISTGVFAGLAFVTRYVGAASLGVIIMTIVFMTPDAKRKGRTLALTLLGALPLMGAWLIRNKLVTGNSMNRASGIHLLGVEDFEKGVLIFWKWLLPGRYGSLAAPVPWMGWAVIALAAGLFLGCVGLWLTYRRESVSEANFGWRAFWSLIVYIFGYFAIVYITISFLDASVNIEERILYPMWMVLWLALFVAVATIWRKLPPLSVIIPVVIFLSFGIGFAIEMAAFVPKFASIAHGWAWAGWAESPAMKLIERLPKDTILYSNQQEAVSFQTGRGAYALLDPIDPSNEKERPGYDDVQAAIKHEVLAGDAVLIFFHIESWLGDGGENWVTRLTDGLPVIYQDTSEWVIGDPALLNDETE